MGVLRRFLIFFFVSALIPPDFPQRGVYRCLPQSFTRTVAVAKPLVLLRAAHNILSFVSPGSFIHLRDIDFFQPQMFFLVFILQAFYFPDILYIFCLFPTQCRPSQSLQLFNFVTLYSHLVVIKPPVPLRQGARPTHSGATTSGSWGSGPRRAGGHQSFVHTPSTPALPFLMPARVRTLPKGSQKIGL